MYSKTLFWDMGLYEICFCVGVLAAFVILRLVADKKNASAKLQNFILIDGFLSVTVGYASAVVFQAVYNYLDCGVFEIKNNTGATFLGGLLGGSAMFLIIYFGVGHFLFNDKENREHLKFLPHLLSLAGTSISAAHAFGRLGCFFAGCCHGVETDGPLGLYMPSVGTKVIPVQLYECIFLFALTAVILILEFKNDRFKLGLPIYMLSYGVWRFLIEYLRGDDRGASIVSFLSPSQFISIILFVGGAVLLLVMVKIYGRKDYGNTETE